jgi:hypothetical protein
VRRHISTIKTRPTAHQTGLPLDLPQDQSCGVCALAASITVSLRCVSSCHHTSRFHPCAGAMPLKSEFASCFFLIGANFTCRQWMPICPICAHRGTTVHRRHASRVAVVSRVHHHCISHPPARSLPPVTTCCHLHTPPLPAGEKCSGPPASLTSSHHCTAPPRLELHQGRTTASAPPL